jgi:hypothetical protein
MIITVDSKSYFYWSLENFIEEFKYLNESRMDSLIKKVQNELGIGLPETIHQIQLMQGPAYDIFVETIKIGNDDFFQEVFTCFYLIDFLDKDKIQGVAFPVKRDCGVTISLVDLKNVIENNSEYDFLFKKDDVYLKIQLKSSPEKYISEFNSSFFINNIANLIKKYNDSEMILVYLLQPSLERSSMEELNTMYEEICQQIGDKLLIKNIYFFVRKDLSTYSCTQIYRSVIHNELKTENMLENKIRR